MKINKSLRIIVLLVIISMISCDNKREVMDSKKIGQEETVNIQETKEQYHNSIDSLNIEIAKLSESKENIQKKIEFSNANIYNNLKMSFLDHIIIGTKNLEETKNFLTEKLGFKIKEGRKHKNGISNFFIEFKDSSEIEFMSISTPSDLLTKAYNSLIRKNKFGLQFALRSNKIIELSKHFQTTSSNFSELTENKNYTTLSQKSIKQELPLFFINYNESHNFEIEQANGSIGILAIWLSTPNLRETINQYSEFGFSLVDTVTVANIENKTALMKNDNFEIILLESKNYAIAGMTIKTDNIEEVKNLLTKNLGRDLKISKNKRGESIYLSPQITNSIWFEFLEN